MYSTCIFCNRPLGTNEVVEEFPIGRRVAFDPERGRLWVLCGSCRQWNLSPIETRWEALEALERVYRETPQRYSTDQIGLARHREGLEIVRIGRPTRPEYAAWRYGGELLRRRRRALVLGTAGVVGGGVFLGGVGAGLLAGGLLNVVNIGIQGTNIYRLAFRTAARVEGPDGSTLALNGHHAQRAHLVREEDVWRLRFPHLPGPEDLRSEGRLRRFRQRLGAASNTRKDPHTTLDGEAAIRAAGRILPALNTSGGSRKVVTDASRFLEETGTIDAAFQKATRTVPSALRTFTVNAQAPQSALSRLPTPVRLALEMAAQEEAERWALEGELARLQAEWREAEEVAAIADDLLLPDRVRRLLGR